MEAFTENPLVTTRTHGGGADSFPLVLGSLAGGAAIATPTALAGTIGVDCKLIHGDRWQEIVGNETDDITGNLKTTIEGDEKRLLMGDLDTTVMGKTKDDRFGMYLGEYFSASTFNYFHTRTENHTAQEQEHQPTSHAEVINEEKKEKKESFEATAHKEELTGFSIGGTGVKIEGVITAAEVFGAKAGMGGIEATGLGWRHKSEALESKLDALAAKITGADVEAGGPDTSIRPVFIGILVAVHIDSPFA